MTHRKCATCRHFADAGFAGSGWCRHPERERDALVMVRKNELGCNQGWKKDFWEPLAGGGEPTAPSGVRPTYTGAELAATVMRACPLDEQGSHDAAESMAREDVVVGHQPIMRGFERRKPVPPPVDDRGVALSRDPGEAIRRAHEVFRETASQRPRRDHLTAPLHDERPPERESVSPDAVAQQSNDAAGVSASSEPRIERGRDEGGADEPSSADGSGTEVTVEADLEHDDLAFGCSARPSRWQVAPTAPAGGTVQIDEESTAVADEGEHDGARPTVETSEIQDQIFPTQQQPRRPLEQPASLSRHRWPPRNAGDAGLFPPILADRDAGPRRAALPTASLEQADQGDQPERQLPMPEDHGRREWQERWKAHSLIREDQGRTRPDPSELDGDGPQLSHRTWAKLENDSSIASETSADVRYAGNRNGRAAENIAEPAAADSTLPRARSEAEAVGVLPDRAGPEFATNDENERSSWLDEQIAGVPRVCMTCRDFRPAESGERGWCTNDWAFSHRTMVAADTRPCQTAIGSWWLPHETIWLEPIDVQGHGLPTPLVDTYLREPKERAARKRS